jgi:site-specific DNA-methyltransferase (adenine-specific)
MTELNQMPACSKPLLPLVVGGLTITCEENMELMKRYPDKYFDLAIVDPPYGIGMDNSNKRTKPSRPNSYTDKYKDFRYHDANWDNSIPSKEYFEELFRVSKNQIIWGANYFCEFLPSGTGWVFWNKLNGLDNCFSDGEFAYSSKGIQSKYFECSTFHDLKGGKDRIHPTQKPTKLYKWLLKNYAKENDKILDTHLGSGSIAIACHDYKFELTACELDPEYFEKAKQRIINHVAQQSLF